jgi:hypothetical protein
MNSHVADNLGCHFTRFGRAVLEGALNDGHDESQRRGVDKVDEFGFQ